ncbi:MAG TPA: response regulator [Thermoanaerobaculia bacterium]
MHDGQRSERVSGARARDVRGPAILVADDDPAILQLMNAVCRRESFRCDTARDVSEALEKLQSGETYDLLVVDVMLPKMKGDAIVAALREMSARPAVIVVTAEPPSPRLVDGSVVHAMLAKSTDLLALTALIADVAEAMFVLRTTGSDPSFT